MSNDISSLQNPLSPMLADVTSLDFFTEKLGVVPLDFSARWQSIQRDNHADMTHSAAGVLLLIHKDPTVVGVTQGYTLHLIKRSPRVSQGGDLSCPGGLLHPAVDKAFRFLMMYRSWPFFQGRAKATAKRRDPADYRLITLFYANALRESWEEIGLNPGRVRFLGALPTYSLYLFKRTIFPLVGYLVGKAIYRPNREVDKVVEIPLRHLFDEERYARYTIDAVPSLPARDNGPWDFPCFVFDDRDNEEILWGATFNIIMSFLHIVYEFTTPDVSTKRRRYRQLRLDYLKGRDEG